MQRPAVRRHEPDSIRSVLEIGANAAGAAAHRDAISGLYLSMNIMLFGLAHIFGMGLYEAVLPFLADIRS